MSDLSLTRYRGYSALPEARALTKNSRAEQPGHLDNGVHLIAVQGADGGLVVGDSHHYESLPDPFAPASAEADILDEYEARDRPRCAAGRGALDRHLCRRDDRTTWSTGRNRMCGW